MRKGNISSEKQKMNINVNKNKEYTKKDIIKLSVWFAIFVFVYYQIYVLVSYTIGNRDKNGMWLYNAVHKVVTQIAPQAKETTEEHTLKLAALGDIYTSTNILKGAKSGSSYDFSDSLTKTKDVISKYDVVLASLNTPVAGSKVGYSTKTVYNSPNELLDAIKALGVSVVATAGNHTMDKGESGVNATLEQLQTAGLNQIGINSSNNRAKPYIIDKNNIKIAILSYRTTSKSKITKGKEYLVNELTKDNVKADMEYIKAQNVDYVICYLNIPNEDNTLVNAEQKNNVDMLFENGVNVVLGTGSKVVQGKTEDMYEMTDGTKNHVYAIYSLGDFIGDMDKEARKVSIGADITFSKTITKDKKGNVIEARTKKNMMMNEPLYFYTKVTTTYKTTNYPIGVTLDAYNQDKIDLDAKDYKAMKTAKEDLNDLLK